MENKHLLRISELATKSGVTPRTVRFYIQEGLLPQPIKTGKTMAYYPEGFINKIRAIKYAQAKRFLPLIIIKKILEQNNYNYSVLLNGTSHRGETKKSLLYHHQVEAHSRYDVERIFKELKIGNHILKDATRKKWVRPVEEQGKRSISAEEYRFFKMFSHVQDSGINWKEFAVHFRAIEKIIEKTIQIESRTLFKWMLNKPINQIEKLLELEETVTTEFIARVRQNSFRKILNSYTSKADNAYWAIADEGFALPEDEVIDQLEDFEKRLKVKHPDLRSLIDLATGYSCMGHLNHSKRVLGRVLKLDPDNLDARVRMIWYRRYTKRKAEREKLESQLKEIVTSNPRYALGHAFAAAWYAFESLGIEESKEILHYINLSLHHVKQAEKGRPRDLHDWVLIKYIKGKICFTIPPLIDHVVDKSQPFKELITHLKDINEYYKLRMPFFLKWLWPNVFYFYGIILLQESRYKQALKVLEKGMSYRVNPPYENRLKKAIAKAKRADKERSCT